MTTKDEALKMAIEALDEYPVSTGKLRIALEACKEALEVADRPEQPAQEYVILDGIKYKKPYTHPAPQPAQEPVAWIVKEHLNNPISAVVRTKRPANECITPLYLHQDGNYIDDEKILDIAADHDCWQGSDTIEFVRDILKHTHPHQWQGLTDDEIEKVFESIETSTTHRKIYHAIEAKLKEKNNAIN